MSTHTWLRCTLGGAEHPVQCFGAVQDGVDAPEEGEDAPEEGELPELVSNTLLLSSQCLVQTFTH